MKNGLFTQLRALLRCLLLAILAVAFTRMLLYVFNPDLFSLSAGEAVTVIWQGLRFDLAAVAAYLAPFLLIYFIPVSSAGQKNKQGLLWFLYGLGMFLLIFLNGVDSIYYNFTLKRSTADLLAFVTTGDDTWRLLPRFLVDFWYVLLLCSLIVYAVIRAYGQWGPRISAGPVKTGYVVQSLFALLLTAGLTVLAIRGGIQIKPLRIINAVEAAGIEKAPLVLNTPFTIMKSIGKEQLPAKSYFKDKELKEIFLPISYPSDSVVASRKKNVVLIILESFSKEYMGAPYGREDRTPFLDSLAGEGLFFNRAFANGKKSIDGIPAIIAGIPSLMDEPYITSLYSNNQVEALAQLLSRKGYATSFFHGGKTGTMGFDAFAKLAGFQRYYGMEDYPDVKDFDGNWGIFDEHFFQFFAEKLREEKKPFFSTFFSLSSHHPYTIPAAYASRFADGKHPLLNTIAYTDMALARFFATAKQMPWYDNTLFVITADHTGQGMNAEGRTLLGNFAIPLLFFSPSDSRLQGSSNKVAQQIDLQPSLLNYLGNEQPIFSFGQNLLGVDPGFAITYLNKVYQYVQGEYVLHFDGEKVIGFYKYPNDLLLRQNLLSEKAYASLIAEYARRCKAIIQTYQQALRNNQQMAANYLHR